MKNWLFLILALALLLSYGCTGEGGKQPSGEQATNQTTVAAENGTSGQGKPDTSGQQGQTQDGSGTGTQNPENQNKENLTVITGTGNGSSGQGEPDPELLDTNLKVYVFPNGASDSILIKRQGFTMLFGTGKAEFYNRLKSYLDMQGVNKLDIVVLPNEWDEQMGAFQFLKNDFKIAEVWKYPLDFTRNYSKDALYQAKLHGTLERHVSYGDSFEKNGLNIRILNPQKEQLNSEYQDSIAMKLGFVDFCMLLFSESEQSIEYKLKGIGEDLGCQVIKASRHGGATATSDLLIRTAKPEAIIFTTDGSADRPHKTTLERIRIYNATSDPHVDVYQTHINGMVTVVSDGKLYNISSEE